MEQFANVGQAVLNNGTTLTSSATSTVVSTRVNIPSSGTFRILIDTEIIKVTAVSGTTWTIVRGDGGSTAASHTDGTTIYVIVTAEALNALVSIQNSDTEVSTRRVLDFDGHFAVTDDSGNARCKIAGSTFGEVIVSPVLTNFTFLNHSIAGTPTATQQGSGIYLYHPGTSGDNNIELYEAAPSTPYSITAKISLMGFTWGFVSAGLYFSDGTKLFRIVFQLNANQVVIDKYTAWNTFSSSVTSFNMTECSPLSWFKIRDDGTNKTFFVSFDGINWILCYTETSTTYLATTTRVGIAVNGNSGGANTGKITGLLLHSWAQGT